MGGEREDNNSLWDPLRPGNLLKVPWEIPLGGGRQLASSVPQPSAGTSEVGAAVSGAYQGGIAFPYFREDLCSGGSGGHAL